MTEISEPRETRLNAATPALLGTALAFLFIVAFFYGRQAHAEADRAEAVVIEQENRSFCVALGLAPPTEGFVHCTNGLNDIRRLQRSRWEASAAGLL